MKNLFIFILIGISAVSLWLLDMNHKIIEKLLRDNSEVTKEYVECARLFNELVEERKKYVPAAVIDRETLSFDWYMDRLVVTFSRCSKVIFETFNLRLARNKTTKKLVIWREV